MLGPISAASAARPRAAVLFSKLDHGPSGPSYRISVLNIYARADRNRDWAVHRLYRGQLSQALVLEEPRLRRGGSERRVAVVKGVQPTEPAAGLLVEEEGRALRVLCAKLPHDLRLEHSDKISEEGRREDIILVIHDRLLQLR